MSTYFGFKAVSIPGEHNFVSYNRYDNEEIALIVKTISEQRPVWYDEGLIPGLEWETEIINQIKSCKMAVFFAGKALFNREESYVCDEYRFVEENKKVVLCIWLDDLTDMDTSKLSKDMHNLWLGLNKMPSATVYDKTTVEEKANAVMAAMDAALKNANINYVPDIPYDTNTTDAEPKPKPKSEPEQESETSHEPRFGSVYQTASGVAGAAASDVSETAYESLTYVEKLKYFVKTVGTSKSLAPADTVKLLLPIIIPVILTIVIVTTVVANITNDNNIIDSLIEKSDGIKYVDDIQSVDDVEVGQLLKFGTYEQDNDTSNGAEDIEWRILDIEDGRLLLITDKLLDYVPYNETLTSVTWETCTLRRWMNNDFFENAFTVDEQNRISITNNINLSNDGSFADEGLTYLRSFSNNDGGDDTQDKIFALSLDEAKAYFESSEDRDTSKTIYVDEKMGTSNWWLRSPGYINTVAEYVDTYGGMGHLGFDVNLDGVAVRPALWVEI